MKHLSFFMTILMVGILMSCHSNSSKNKSDDSYEPENVYDWEMNRKEILKSTDMALIYSGGKQRQEWNKEQMDPYVSYFDVKGRHHWLFDSFLFLEITSTKDWATDGLTYTRGYGAGRGLKSANKQDWLNLIDRYFDANIGIGGLERSIEAAIKKYGEPQTKRQVVIGIPESVMNEYWNDSTSVSTYWGKIDGEVMDFSHLDHRVKACVWYIDQVRQKFNQLHYKNVDLAGFYWIAEDVISTRTLIKPVADYLEKLKYSFNWIPYFRAKGSSEWKSFGFSQAYHQPNYYFSKEIPFERLEYAGNDAEKYGMSMEMEFDETCLVGNGTKAYRLRDYMKAYRSSGVWATKPLAYYQGNTAVSSLAKSKNPEDQKLYHEFCSFVIERPIRKSH